MVGKAERQAGAQEIYWSEADGCSYAEEIVGDDEGQVGAEEEGKVDR